MKKYFINIYFSLLLVISFQATTQACSCVGKMTIKESYKSSIAVFTGTVLSIDTVTITDTIFKNYYKDSLYIKTVTRTLKRITVLIEESYKGKFFKNNTIVVETDLGNGDCGYVFNIGSKYLVYTYFQKRYLNNKLIAGTIPYTNICTRTSLVSKETGSELKMLNRLKR